MGVDPEIKAAIAAYRHAISQVSKHIGNDLFSDEEKVSFVRGEDLALENLERLIGSAILAAKDHG